MHVQDIIPKAIRTLGLLRKNVRTSSPQLKELTSIQGFSPTPARIRLYCMVPLVKIPCGVLLRYSSTVLPTTYTTTTILTPMCPP